VWRNWYIFSNDYLNGLQSTFLASSQLETQIQQHLKKFEGLSEDDVARKCRLSGLCLEGGMSQQKYRLARLEAYLQPAPTMAQDKRSKQKIRRQNLLKSKAKKREEELKPKDPKTSGWMTIEEKAEEKPPVPVSQWIQQKQVTLRIAVVPIAVLCHSKET